MTPWHSPWIPRLAVLVTFAVAAGSANAGISVGSSLPPGALISNPVGPNGSSAVGSGTTPVKGNSFVLASTTSISAVTFRIASVSDVVGDVALDFYTLTGTPDSAAGSGQVPTGASLRTQTETLPTPAIAPDDYVTIALDAPLALAAGNYAFALSTSNAVFNVRLNKSNTYLQGELVRQVSATSAWEDRANDMVFAIEATGDPTRPTISSFTATPDEIVPGDSVTLAWTTANATGLSIDQGIGDVTGLTSTQITVNAATTFELIATNANGSVTSSVSVSLLLHPPTIESFTAIDLGENIELTWQTTGAVTLSIDNGVGEVTGQTSTQVVDAAVSSYILTAINADGTTTASATVRPPAAAGPNVVFVLVDDWGWTDHSNTNMAQGYPSLYFESPNFDRLVDAGVAFTSTYAQPNCAPTRAALLTGQYSCRTGNGVYNVTSLSRAGGRTTYTTAANQGDEHINGDEQTITIGEAFINSGYVTAHFGKYHAGSSVLTDPTYVLNQGFDYNFGGKNDGAPGAYHALTTTPRTFHGRVGPELDPFAADYDMTYISNNLIPYANGNDPTTLDGTQKHLTDAMADAFISFMDNHRGGSMSDYPVYAQVHFYAVHGPVQPRSDLKTKYDHITPPPGSTHNNASYAALIEGMDHSLGRIIDYLNDPNGDGNPVDSITTNTLLVFCSDNGGTHASNEPLRGEKGMHYDGGIRVPAVVSMPGTIPSNTVSDTLIHVVDFYPTMLDFAGGIYPDATNHPLDGVSLHNHLLDPDHTARNREPIFYHFPGYMDNRAYASSMMIKEVDGKRYKYIYAYDPYYDPGSGTVDGFDQYQLYNLTDDIGETVNLLDYVDVENAADPNDPSTPEEYWNDLRYQDLGNQMAADLNAWLVGDPGDTTWTPIHVTYKSNFPGIDPGLVGQEAGPPPASIPVVIPPPSQSFHITKTMLDVAAGQVTIPFVSASGFVFNIEGSFDLDEWAVLEPGIDGQADLTTRVVHDSFLATATSRYYRVALPAP